MQLLWLAIAFLLGAIPFGLLSARWVAGVDPRQAGSGNVGFTNVLRVSSKLAALFTLIGDVGKGALAVWLVRRVGGGGLALEMAAGLAAVAGHIFSPFLSFKGGKGVATAFGAIGMAMPWVGLTALVIWGVVLAASSYVSLASIVAFLVMPVTMMLFTAHPVTLGAGIGMTGLILLRHRENIQRLRAGVEHSIRTKSQIGPSSKT